MILDRERVLESKVFAIDRVELPGGVQRHLVVHGGSIVVLPVADDGRVVMIRNQRWAVGQTLWELCAGTLEKDEDPLAAAGRELIEETGYEARNLRPLCGFYTCPGFCTEYLHCFLATGLRHVGQALDEAEQITVELLPAIRVLEMIRTGEITDAKSIAAMLYWWTFVNDRDAKSG